jgi:hypothetical protein
MHRGPIREHRRLTDDESDQHQKTKRNKEKGLKNKDAIFFSPLKISGTDV